MGDDGEVEVSRLHAVDEVRRRLARHCHLGARVRAREAGQDLGQVAVGVVVGQPEPHAADELGLREGGEAFGVQPHDPARVVEETITLVGQPRAAAVALEHGPTDALLEPLHLHRHGALRLVHDVGRPRERARVGDGDEGSELVDVEEVHGRLLINER
jgi:hypothetical protein